VMRRQSLHANVHAAPHFARQVGSLLDRQHHPLQVEVSRQIKEHLARRDLTQATVAGLLGMSARTLQRQLRSLGVSYQQLLADERQAAAKRLLSDRSLTIYQVAHELGYEEVSAFYRAFRLWTGLSPSAYRRHLV
jgi:AraC-like DNA-binding protein